MNEVPYSDCEAFFVIYSVILYQQNNLKAKGMAPVKYRNHTLTTYCSLFVDN